MRAERIERRVLAALRFVDATTGGALGRPLVLEAAGCRFVRNLSGYYVLTAAPGLAPYTASFLAPPADPAAGSMALTVAVRDPGGRYLPRRVALALPLAVGDGPGQLFQVMDVPLAPAPAAPTRAGWAVIRVAVTAAGTERGLAGALLRVVRTGAAARLAFGLSDARGEALLAVAGLPVTTWDASPGPVLVSEIDATLEAVFDPAAGAPPDPDDLEARRAGLPSSKAAIKLASGRTLVAALAVALP